MTAQLFAAACGMDQFPGQLPRGAIIGSVVLKNIYSTGDPILQLSSLERLYGDYTAGRWAWELGDAEMFEAPIAYRGALMLFDVEWPPEQRS